MTKSATISIKNGEHLTHEQIQAIFEVLQAKTIVISLDPDPEIPSYITINISNGDNPE